MGISMENIILKLLYNKQYQIALQKFILGIFNSKMNMAVD